MELGEALYRVVGGSSPHSTPAMDLRAAQARAGGVSQLARALGVDRTTVQRWNRSGRPSEAGEALISAALRHARASESGVRDGRGLTLTGDQEGRGNRTIRLGPADLAPGMWPALKAAYAAGATTSELSKLAGRFIKDPFYKRLLTGEGRKVPGSNYEFSISSVRAA